MEPHIFIGTMLTTGAIGHVVMILAIVVGRVMKPTGRFFVSLYLVVVGFLTGVLGLRLLGAAELESEVVVLGYVVSILFFVLSWILVFYGALRALQGRQQEMPVSGEGRELLQDVSDKQDVDLTMQQRMESAMDRIEERLDAMETEQGAIRGRLETEQGYVRERLGKEQDLVKGRLEKQQDKVEDTLGKEQGEVRDRLDTEQGEVRGRLEGVEDETQETQSEERNPDANG